jgi:outer membrane protein
MFLRGARPEPEAGYANFSTPRALGAQTVQWGVSRGSRGVERSTSAVELTDLAVPTKRQGMNWRASFVLVAMLVGLLVPGVARAEVKIAVVDLQRAMMQTEDGLRAQATIKKFFDKRQQELDRRQEELGRERDDLGKQSKVLSRAALQRRMELWQRRMIEVQTLFVEYNKELQKKQSELTAPIIRKMFGVVQRIARRRNIDLVVDKPAAPYARADLDLTDMVVQQYNSGGGGDDEEGAAGAGTGTPGGSGPPTLGPTLPGPAPSLP